MLDVIISKLQLMIIIIFWFIINFINWGKMVKTNSHANPDI